MSTEKAPAATAEAKPAATEVKAEEKPKKSKPTTSERLFPERFPKAEPKPEAEAKPEPKAEEPAKSEATPTTPAEEREIALEEVLKEKGLDTKKVRVRAKVDGKDADTTLEDLIAGYQLREHHNAQGKKIGDERKALIEERRAAEAERKMLEELRAEMLRDPKATATPANPNDVIAELRKELAEIKARQDEIVPAVQPVIVQNARTRVAKELAEEGFKGADKWDEEVQSYLDSIEDETVRNFEIQKANTFSGAKHIYKLLQAQKAAEEAAKAKPASPKAEREAPIVKVDGGSSSGAPKVDDFNLKYAELFTAWKNETDPLSKKEKLSEILRLKRV